MVSLYRYLIHPGFRKETGLVAVTLLMLDGHSYSVRWTKL